MAHVSFIDNQPCLDLIESNKQGILSMVDEEVNTDPPSQLARRIVIAAAVILPLALIVGLSILARRLDW